VVLNIDALGSCMVLWVVCKGDGSLIVAVDDVLFADVFAVADFFQET